VVQEEEALDYNSLLFHHKMNRKGVLGLDVVKAVFLAFIVLVVLGVAVILVGISLRDVAETIDVTTTQVNNETLTTVTETGELLTYSTQRNVDCTISECINASSGTNVPSTNYTETGCLLKFTTGDSLGLNNSDWNCTYSAKYSEGRQNAIAVNLSGGISGFFGNTGTIISILVVVVIIAAIGIVIAIISGFGGTGGMRRKSEGAGTVMGV